MTSELLDGLVVFQLRSHTPGSCINADLVQQVIDLGPGGKFGQLFVGSSEENTPPWLMALSPMLQAEPPALRTRLARAVWIIARAGHCMAITFGHGRFLIKSSQIVPGFGLRCVLNSVDADSIRSVRKKTLDMKAAHARNQAVDDIPIDDFGIDPERDLLRGVDGVPRDKDLLGSRIHGADSLSIKRRVVPEDVPNLLGQLEKISASTEYQKRFDWVDRISPIREDTLILGLEARIDEILKNGGRKHADERLFLALPDLSEIPVPQGFRVRGSQNQFDDLSLPAIKIALQNRTIDVPFLKGAELVAVDENDHILGDWPLFSCLHFETTINKFRAMLVGGEWFKIDPDFEKQIKADVSAIPTYGIPLPAYTDTNEGAYNERVVANSGGKSFLLDKKLVRHGGGKSAFEICDILTDQRALIHVKRYEGASQAMSHLFFQALASARMLKRDGEFREKANSILPEAMRFADPTLPLDSSQWEVVFGIISSHQKNAAASLAFFAQISLVAVHRALSKEMGFKVSLGTIHNSKGIRLRAPPRKART